MLTSVIVKNRIGYTVRGHCKISGLSLMEQWLPFCEKMKKADSEEPTFHGIINYANNKIHH